MGVVNTSTMDIHLVTHSLWEVITIATVSAIVSLITIVGNVLVMVSFKVNSQLKTVNNYYLLSLAAADLIIGVFSMNLYTSYILMGYWALGNLACDLWLALDYVASNASVMNLLVISFDRYFSITRPLTYRAKRTPKRAGIMIGLAWLVSLVLWAPPILCWQYFVGKRTVPERQCQIQFFSEPVITFGTAIAAFYVPVSVMTILYCRIYKETEKRTKDLAELQGINCSTESGVAQPQKTIIRSCFSCKLSSASQDRNQASWSSSTRSNAVKSAATTSDEWSKAGQLTTFNSYASSEDEDRPSGVCSESEQLSSYDEESFFQTPPKSNSQKSSKCVSYKFKPVTKESHTEHQSRNGDTKITSPTFSSAESMSVPSTSTMSKPIDTTLKSQITKRKRMVLIKEERQLKLSAPSYLPKDLPHALTLPVEKKRIEEKLYWYGQNPVVSSKMT
uniref:Muscarinic acetylcholine receptor n=1 Tax=Maylandia zebra TaxID=106582 RepID=A0A3P9BSM9_9CICH